jgi:hypothetical protein
MKKLGKAGSTFGTVVAAAVVISFVGAGGAVAGGLITSKQIKNNTIKSIDVRDGSLTGADVADGSIGGADITDGSVGNADIANGAIGKAKIASAAQGYTSVVTKRVVDSGVANGASSTLTVQCAAGQVAIGGGAFVVHNGLNFTGITNGILQASLPTSSGMTVFDTPGNFPAGDAATPDGWRTTVQNDQGVTEDAYHYALCASK